MPHFRTCTLCEAMCGLEVAHEAGRITGIRGDAADPFSRGHICPKGVALQDLDTDPDRLRRPVKRVGDAWVEIGWREAFDLVAGRLHAIQDRHGRDAVAIYNGNPTVHSLGAMLFVPGFARALHTRQRYSATSVDQLPHHLASSLMFGHMFLIPIPDLDRTDHLLVLGANPAVSNGSLMTAGNTMARIEAIRSRGGRVVVVDPRRTETADAADRHVAIRPGTDALLLLAMLHVVLGESLARPGRLEAMCTGLDEVRALVRDFPPERVAAATGIDATTIAELARDFARAERAVCYGRVGISMQPFGALACWLVNVLNIVTGNFDRAGGAMFPTPAVDPVGLLPKAMRIGRWKTRVRGLPEYEGELPVVALAEEMDTPGPGQVRALVTQSGNPVLSTPNGERLSRAIASLEFYVAIDFYVNETTRHAHVILPPAGPLERAHYDLVFNAFAVRNTARLSLPLRERTRDARHDWEILNALTWRLARGPLARVTARARAAALSFKGPLGLLDVALARGTSGLTVERLRAAPHGIDLGPLEPRLPGRLRTADGRIALAPPHLLADVPRLASQLTAPAVSAPGATPAGGLVLVGRRALRSNNSWMRNSERLVRGKNACTLLMHPSDATSRHLADGSRVTVTSRVGRVEVELRVSDRMMPGVVSLPHGHSAPRAGTRLRVAGALAGASINDLTDDQRIDAAIGTAAFSGVPVEVRPAGDAC